MTLLLAPGSILAWRAGKQIPTTSGPRLFGDVLSASEIGCGLKSAFRLPQCQSAGNRGFPERTTP
jgi:hypothetical protein